MLEHRLEEISRKSESNYIKQTFPRPDKVFSAPKVELPGDEELKFENCLKTFPCEFSFTAELLENSS